MIIIRPLLIISLLLMSWTNLSAQTGRYQSTLLLLCDALLKTQISSPSDPNFGALVCPSINPDDHPLHSRAGEAVYPFAIAYKLTGKIQYRDAAIKLGNWMIGTQEISGKRSGGWSENWPDPQQKGWYGTTTDQLISLAGAYKVLKPFLTPVEDEKWNRSMEKAADFIAANFPMGGNINYSPTGATTLLFVYQTLNHPKERWLVKADSLMNVNTLKYVDSNHFLTGEGNGIDQGYNMAQSIGYIALYGILKRDEAIRKVAAGLLKTHELFVYPNGSVDNSWGTRSFKWSYESGTKTAPGVYFSFALLADLDPEFGSAAMKCLDYLTSRCMKDGWIVYGPGAENHTTATPPCNYSTFARAQSLALAIEYGARPTATAPFPAQKKDWFRFFPEMKLAVIRTEGLMATISGYGQIDRYPRESVSRGGSITNLWMEGFGKNGFVQSSSSSAYKRLEALHMPIENELLPLTPRIEFNVDSAYFTNTLEDSCAMMVQKESNDTKVIATGILKTSKGIRSKVSYQLTHWFSASGLVKEYRVSGDKQNFRIIEPIVNEPGTSFKQTDGRTVKITFAKTNAVWELKILSSTRPCRLTTGKDATKYWCPFPGIEAFPLTISFQTTSEAPQTVRIAIKRVK